MNVSIVNSVRQNFNTNHVNKPHSSPTSSSQKSLNNSKIAFGENISESVGFFKKISRKIGKWLVATSIPSSVKKNMNNLMTRRDAILQKAAVLKMEALAAFSQGKLVKVSENTINDQTITRMQNPDKPYQQIFFQDKVFTGIREKFDDLEEIYWYDKKGLSSYTSKSKKKHGEQKGQIEELFFKLREQVLEYCNGPITYRADISHNVKYRIE